MASTWTLVGAIIDGKYRVERVLGQGGMSVVVAARHVRLGQLVAIKFPLTTTRARDDSVERLLREARSMMRIRSEHVAKVHDVGLHESAGPYLIMEYLVGRDLGTVLANDGPLPVTAAVQCVLQACEALAEAHAKGIVHRDVKPSNLFLSTRADGDPHVKVIDFGLAKTLQTDDQVALTRTGAMLGSPLFMAPEQMRGSDGVDARADIWALGATLYALLTGGPPFPGRNLLEVHERVKLGPPKLIATLPHVGTAIETALLRCFEVEPSARHSTVADFADALAQAAASRGTGSATRIRRILESFSNTSAEDDFPKRQQTERALARDPTQATTVQGLSASWSGDTAQGKRTRVEADASPSLAVGTRTARSPWLAVALIVGLPVVVGTSVSLVRGPSAVGMGKQTNASSVIRSDAPALPSARPMVSASSSPISSYPGPSSVSLGASPVDSSNTARAKTERVRRVPTPAAAPRSETPVRDPLADPD